MALDAEQGKKLLQLVTSRYDDRHWRKKIEKDSQLAAERHCRRSATSHLSLSETWAEGL